MLALVDELTGMLISAAIPRPTAADSSPITAPSNMSVKNTVERVAPRTLITPVSRQRSRELKKVIAPIVNIVTMPISNKSTSDMRLTTLTMPIEILVTVSTKS